MSPLTLGSLVDAARRAVRRDAVLAIAAVVAAAVPVALLIAWLLGGLAVWSAPGPLPLLVLVGATVAAAALGVAAVRLWLRGIDESSVTARAEEAAGLPAGSLRGVLELGRSMPAGTSASLFQREESVIARSFLGRRVRDVSGELGRVTRRRLAMASAGLAGLCLAVAALAFLAPQRTQASWAPLLHPVAHLTPPPLPPLEVRPGDVAVARGEAVDVAVRAPGRAAVTLLWRAQGSVVERMTLPVVGDTTTGRVPRIDSRTTYWIEAPDGARSDDYTISPLDPLLVSELVVEVVFPSYLQRTPERYDADVPPLQVPEGTRLVVRGRATRALGSADLVTPGGEQSFALDVDGERFSAQWQPVASGLYDWQLRDAQGEALAAAPAPLDVTLVADAPPEVELTYPLTDTILPADLVQLVAADARDDHGLASASVVTWRVSSQGEADAEREDPIGLDESLDRSLLRTMLDARDRELLPGDTLKVLFRVTDASPRRQTGESRVLSLYLPGMSEMRERVGDEATALVDEAAEMARTARDVQDATRDLQRRTAASNARQEAARQQAGARSGGSPTSMDYQQSEQARELMEQQEELLRQMEEMREKLESFQNSAERAGVQDAELKRQMEELRELYDKLMTPEMRQRMEELRESLEKMDAQALEEALEKLTEQQEQMRKQLEENVDQLRRAASEQQMNALSQDARELAAQQEALSESMKERQPGAQEAGQQEELSKRTEALQQAMQELRSELERQGEAEAGQETGQASEKAGEASEQMKNAAEDARAQRGQDAAAQGQQAAQQLEQAASTLDGARQTMADAWKKELQETVQQAMDEALSLAQRQQDLLERMEQGQQTPEQQQGQQQQGQQQQGQQAGQQQGQQAGQQQQGQQQQSGGQQQGQQAGQQQGGQQQGGQQQGQQSGGQQQGGQQGGGQQQGAQAGTGTGGTGSAMQAEQQALQQGLEQLGRNLAEAGDRSQLLDRDVGAALGRANLSMQQTLQQMQQQGGAAGEQASQTVEALNRLAMSLLQRSQEIEQSESGSALEQVLEQLAEVAKQQGSLNGQSSAIMPMNLAPNAMAGQAQQIAQEQREIASKLEGMSNEVGRRDDLLGQLDALAREAQEIASTLDGGRLPPEALARQERLFHRLLDAGRTLEKEEYSEERKGELPGDVEVSRPPALDPALLNAADRFRVPTPEELRALPPAYRRLVLEYFARLNRTPPQEPARERR